MSRQIASFIPLFWQPHLEIDCEIMKRHLDEGDSVRAFICNAELPSCYGNLQGDKDVCGTCRYRRRNAIDVLGLHDVQLQGYLFIKPENEEILQKYRGLKITNVDELFAVEYDGCAIGRTIFNELTSHIRDNEPDLSEHSDYIAKAVESFMLVYLSFLNHFETFRPDRFYTFNGRFVVAKAALSAAKKFGIPFAVHDRAFSMNKFVTVFDDSLHSVKYWSTQAMNFWNESPESVETKTAIAENWFAERVRGQKQGWYSFVTEQGSDLPESFDPNKTNLVIFNSSEFETVGMEDFNLPFYDSQNEALERLAHDLAADPDVKVYLRMHPNLKGRNNVQTKFIEEKLTGVVPNFEVIPAESPVSTYNLMRNASAVLTFGSMTGVESAFNGVPSILLGPCWYQDFGFCYRPQSHEELVKSILSRSFKISEEEKLRRRQNTIPYAYFMSSYGRPLLHFKQTDVCEAHPIGSATSIGYSAPSYEDGLKKELEARVELAGLRSNPLASTVEELMGVIEQLRADNRDLKLSASSLAPAVSHESGSRLKRVVRRVIGRTLGR